MKNKVIEISNLWAGYGSEPILHDINLTVLERDFIGLIGPNGGGKSTLLKVILGLLKPMKGSVKIMGRSVDSGKKSIGYVPQFVEFDRNFPVRVEEVVQMGRLGQRKLFQPYNSKDRAVVQQALEIVEMWPMRHLPLAELSGGQRQRVYIARALASQPKILILDEPTASIDSRISQSIYKLLGELNKYITIVIVSHDLAAIYAHVKSIGCLNRRLIYQENKQLTRDAIEQTYKCPMDLIKPDLTSVNYVPREVSDRV
ncbi:MAG: metal ABC transporter ATP-binding protein [Prochloraceae cyanobacterium]|nr:metal ABC transporter ATP-binding protein [Prochloraceae cyanobacterium]